jgi:glycosyltransferase involved in cell wall biosynthesis
MKTAVYLPGLAWRQLRDDPRRAARLAVRMLPPGARGRLARGRLAPLAVPRPRDLGVETRELRSLLDLPLAERAERAGRTERTVLHFVTNAMPRTNAGYTVRTHRIVLAQRDLGLDPHVVTRLGYPLAQGIRDARELVEVDGIPYHRLLPWLPPGDAVKGVAKAVALASRLAEQVRPAVLHAASNHLNAAVALEVGRRHGLPVVYEVRGFLEDSWLSRSPGNTTDNPFYRLTRELETRRMHEADAVVTLGEAMREEIVGRGVDAAKVFVVPNAVDEEFLTPLPSGAGLRRELGIGPGDFVAGLTSSFYSYEGIDTLIDAAAILHERGTPITLLLVGDGPQRPALEERARRGGAKVIFTGRVPMAQVRQYHAVLDVFAVPRRADRVCQLVTPLKPVEAMAGGIPVIASNVKALREIIEPGVTGTLTLPEEPEAWANSLHDVIYSPQRRRKIGQAARDQVSAERTWRAVTARYLDAYAFASGHFGVG